MKRAALVLLLLVPMAAGQLPSSRQPESPLPDLLTFDATVTNEHGSPVPGLSASDFELTHRGERREIERVTWKTGPRHVVVIVDDLGLAVARVAAVKERLRAFVSQLDPEDRAAIVRTSSGAAWQESLTTDRRAMWDQMDQIQPVGLKITDAMSSNAVSQALRWTLDSLAASDTRKVVAILAEPSHLGTLMSNLLPLAHRNRVVIYLISATPPAEANTFAQNTGGLAVPDLETVLRAEHGHYEIAFRPAKEGMQLEPAVLQLHGKMARLRWRAAFFATTQDP